MRIINGAHKAPQILMKKHIKRFRKEKKWAAYRQSDDYFVRYLSVRHEQVGWYNDFAAAHDARLAVSVLSGNRREMAREAARRRTAIEDLTSSINAAVSSDEAAELAVTKASKVIQISLKQTFPAVKPELSGLHEVGPAALKQQINDFFEKKADHARQPLAVALSSLSKAFARKEALENLLLHKKATEYVISEVLTRAYQHPLPHRDEVPTTIERFIADHKQAYTNDSAAANAEYHRAIYAMIKEFIKEESEAVAFHSGRLNIKQAVEYALDKSRNKSSFAEKWGNYCSPRTHKKEFKKVYEGLDEF